MIEQGILKKPTFPGRKFIAVDLDGTLAMYDRYRGRLHIGEPVPAMAARVREWLALGHVVVIFTSRLADPLRDDHQAVLDEIHRWCEHHVGERLYATAVKHGYYSEIWDDAAVRVRSNSGARCCDAAVSAVEVLP